MLKSIFSMCFVVLSLSQVIAQSETTHIPEEVPGNFTYDLVADRLSCIEKEVPLSMSGRVHAFVNYFTTKDREYTKAVLNKSTYYFPIFEKYLKKYNLPQELKYLAIVESGLNPKAISRVGAGGLWQFMPYTGRSYKLHQDWYIDERFDPEKSTEAAVKYLSMLYNMFGDWELALAGYNSGPGNVRKAIRKSGYKKTFNEIYRYLPRETRSYVPQFVAITYSMNYADEHNLRAEDPIYQMEYDTIMVSGFVNLKTLAENIRVCYEDIQILNPGLKRFAVRSDNKLYPIKLPKDGLPNFHPYKDSILLVAANTGKLELQAMAKNTVGSTYGRDKVVYRVRSGDVLGTIAQRYRVRVSDIRKWNNLRGNMIRVGQNLNIWLYSSKNLTATQQSVAKTNTRPAKPIIDTQGRKVYTVQPGDTLWDIARKNEGLNIDKIKQLNNLKSANIKPGQKLILG